MHPKATIAKNDKVKNAMNVTPAYFISVFLIAIMFSINMPPPTRVIMIRATNNEMKTARSLF